MASPSPTVQGATVELGPRAARLYEIQHDPQLAREDRRAGGLITGGAVSLGLGGATLLLVTLPARGLYRRSLDQIERERWVIDQQQPRDRALRRRDVMRVSGAIGGGLTALGVALLTSGLVKRGALRRPVASTLSVAPVGGPDGWGVGASMRF